MTLPSNHSARSGNDVRAPHDSAPHERMISTEKRRETPLISHNLAQFSTAARREWLQLLKTESKTTQPDPPLDRTVRHADDHQTSANSNGGKKMAWSIPAIEEVTCGMEINMYFPAEDDGELF